MRFAILVPAVLAMLLPAAASASPRSCPSIHVQNPKLVVDVSIEHGSVSCKSAAHVLDLFVGGHGVKDGKSWTVEGWKCDYAKIGASCVRGSKDRIAGAITS